MIGIRDERSGEYHLYLTNVPPQKLTAEDVQSVYAARWEIELLFKELKSHYRMEDLPSSKREVVEALVYAAILSLLCGRRLLNLLRQKQKPFSDRLPQQRWAIVFSEVARDILLLLVRPRREELAAERRISEFILHEAVDPNCERPSLLRAVETRRHAYRGKAA
ncbi:MAG: transposase [Deltaproteobacteria bacterium]